MSDKKQEQNYYVGLKEARELRRNLLESSKSLIATMQVQERVIVIQKEKEQLKNKLKEDVKELKMLFLKLEKLMPEDVTQTQEPVIQKQDKKQAQVNPKQPMPKHVVDEVDKLHAHLAMIEARLKNMK